MGLRNLTHWNDELFRKKSRVVEKLDDRLWTLLDDMRDTLEHVGGYGCAAVHVRVLRRVVVINCRLLCDLSHSDPVYTLFITIK